MVIEKGKESFIAPARMSLLITLYEERDFFFYFAELMNLIKHIKSQEEFKIIQMYWFVLKLWLTVLGGKCAPSPAL